jgi:hypothetical protein
MYIIKLFTYIIFTMNFKSSATFNLMLPLFIPIIFICKVQSQICFSPLKFTWIGLKFSGQPCNNCPSFPYCVCESNAALNNGICISCNTNNAYYSGGACTLCSSSINYCITCTSQFVCTSCISTTYLNFNNACTLCSSILTNCSTCTSENACTTCINPSLLVGGNCYLCSVLHSNCATCLADTSCAICQSLFYKAINGSCEPCPTSLVSCTACSDNVTCTACNSDSYLNNGLC